MKDCPRPANRAATLCGMDMGLPGGKEVFAAAYFFGQGNHGAASYFIERAIAAGHPSAGETHATLLYQDGQHAKALEVAEAEIARGNGSMSLAVLVGSLRAAAGQLQSGLAEFGRFVELAQVAPNIAPWRGDSVSGKAIFIPRTLAGFGDEIMWARFAPELAKRGATVFMECAPALTSLFSTLDGVAIGLPVNCDYYAHLLSLPALLGVTEATLPKLPYLNALSKACPPRGRFNIGISWGCGPAGPQNRYCSLNELAPLAAIPGTQLYSLEKGQHAEQLYPPPTGMNVVDLGRTLSDFSQTATWIEAMDLVVSTDNVIANLAGALGKPLLVLAPYCCEFRWGTGERTPWYPSAIVIRQVAPGNWREVAEVAARRVRDMMAARMGALQDCLVDGSMAA